MLAAPPRPATSFSAWVLTAYLRPSGLWMALDGVYVW
jgi:hypothetical protein